MNGLEGKYLSPRPCQITRGKLGEDSEVVAGGVWWGRRGCWGGRAMAEVMAEWRA